jgi:hypothetical protein
LYKLAEKLDMLDFISSETRKIIYNCIERESKEMQLNMTKTRLALYLKADASNGYRLIEEIVVNGKADIKVLKEFSFTGVLGVKIDFKGYSMIAPPFIQKSLLRFSESMNIPYDKVNVVCYPTYKKGQIALCIFNDKAFSKQIELSELFNEEDALQQT